MIVVDENVPIVANEATKKPDERIALQADEACILAAIERLETIVKGGIVVIDEAGEVMSQYRSSLNGSGAPGTGDAFLRHLSDRQYDVSKVRIVSLTSHNDRSYEAFPADPDLAKFDKSDRKFVALANSVQSSRIINAVDSDYSHHQAALAKAGIQVEELCLNCLKPA